MHDEEREEDPPPLEEDDESDAPRSPPPPLWDTSSDSDSTLPPPEAFGSRTQVTKQGNLASRSSSSIVGDKSVAGFANDFFTDEDAAAYDVEDEDDEDDEEKDVGHGSHVFDDSLAEAYGAYDALDDEFDDVNAAAYDDCVEHFVDALPGQKLSQPFESIGSRFQVGDHVVKVGISHFGPIAD